ncbi:hypothetical protein Fcan01_26554 [Folsomia candida]|uniref:Uncharacterized protein n=1 Tax=Folsomia candida TaxID=158441 RepID=A0A226D0P7_FOLCA|nr:hypothetical protein Fcan01_26554 [Folsomia candida]
MISDLNSIAFSSIPIVTTGREIHSFAHHAKEFTSFLTDEIETRLIVDVNNSNIYSILNRINDRTNFLLSSWYDFAFNVSKKLPMKTHNGYKPNPEIFVLMDEEVACDALIKLLAFNKAYFPISYWSSGLQESGIYYWWQHRFSDRGLLHPSSFYTNKSYLGTDLHRALIHWPPKKLPEFENDVVGLRNFIMFAYILVFFYFLSGLLALREALLGKDYIGLGCFPPKIDSHKDWTLLDAVEEEGQTALQFQDL